MKGQQNSKYAGKKNSSKHQGRNEDQKKAKTEINLRKYLKLKRRLRKLINLQQDLQEKKKREREKTQITNTRIERDNMTTDY